MKIEYFNHKNVKEIINEKPIAAYRVSSSSCFTVLFENKKAYRYFTSDFDFNIETETFDKSLVYEIVESVPELEELIGFKSNKEPKRGKYEMKLLYMGHGSKCIIREYLLYLADEYAGGDTFFIKDFYAFLDKMIKIDLSIINLIKHHKYIEINNEDEKVRLVNDLRNNTNNIDYLLITSNLALKNICNEIDKRYMLFVENKVRNIEQYKQQHDLNYITVIVDDIARSEEVEKNLKMILNLGRSAGVYLIAMGDANSWLNELPFPNK